jgi:hypothetical protein
MKLCNNTAQDSDGVFEVCNLYDILDQVADKMDNIRQVEHCWNFVNKELSMKPSVSSTIAYDSTYPRATHRVNDLYVVLSPPRI